MENSWKNKKQISNSPRVFLEQNKKQDYVKFDGVSYKSYCVYGVNMVVRDRYKVLSLTTTATL